MLLDRMDKSLVVPQDRARHDRAGRDPWRSPFARRPSRAHSARRPAHAGRGGDLFGADLVEHIVSELEANGFARMVDPDDPGLTTQSSERQLPAEARRHFAAPTARVEAAPARTGLGRTGAGGGGQRRRILVRCEPRSQGRSDRRRRGPERRGPRSHNARVRRANRVTPPIRSGSCAVGPSRDHGDAAQAGRRHRVQPPSPPLRAATRSSGRCPRRPPKPVRRPRPRSRPTPARGAVRRRLAGAGAAPAPSPRPVVVAAAETVPPPRPAPQAPASPHHRRPTLRRRRCGAAQRCRAGCRRRARLRAARSGGRRR